MIKWMLVIMSALFLAFVMSAAGHLDDETVSPTTQDATESAQCANRSADCRVKPEDDEAVRDPRVQNTLRHLCKEGQAWACKLINKENAL